MIRILNIFISLLFAWSVAAQSVENILDPDKNKHFIIKERTVNEGLASNSIRKIGKTDKGLLMIATYNGLSFFDGKNFRNYTSENTPVIPSNNIYDFCVDQDSVFWIASYNGIVAYDGIKFYVPDRLKNIDDFNVQCINFDKKGTLWIGTIANGLYTFKDDQLSKVKELKNLKRNIVSLLFPDNKGNMWIGTEQGELYKYDGEVYESIVNSKVSNGMLTATETKDGKLYFGSRNGLYVYEDKKITLVNNEASYINDIKVDEKGRVWLATNSGLYFYNEFNKKILPVINRKGLSNQIIQSLYFDENDIVWIGTYRKGLLQLRIGAFKNYSFVAEGINEIPSALAELNDSIIIVGTDEGKLFELENGYYKRVKLFNNVESKRIKCILIDSKNIKWICTYSGLIKIEDGVEKILGINTGLPDNTLRAIIENDNETYWVGTRQSGLYLINKDLEILNKYNTSNGLASNFVMSLVKGTDGNVFVATKNGIDVIKDNKITNHIGVEDGLIEGLVFNVYEDKDRTLWIATIGGLSRYKNGKVTGYNKEVGLENDKVFDVLEDDLGYLWMPTIDGIIRVAKIELEEFAEGKRNKIFSILYDKSDGILNQQYVSASKALKLKNGNIAFNTISGVSILNPKVANTVITKPRIFVEQISTGEKSHKIGSKEKLAFASNKYLQIDYVYIDYIHPDKAEFSYKLEPFDNEWQNAKSERFAKYTNLPPGSYKFTVKASVKAHDEIEVVNSVSFVLNPAFYETIWFKLTAVLILILLIFTIYTLRLRKIREQKEVLENEVKDRTSEIVNQKEEIQKNIEELEKQKQEIAVKNEEILLTRNTIEQAYLNLKLLSDLGKEITSSLSEDEIAKTLYQNVTILMDADIIAIGNLNKSKNVVEFNTTIYRGKKLDPFVRDLEKPKCIICDAINNDTDIVSNNISEDFPNYGVTFPERKSLKAFSSLIIIPFRSKGEISGVLTVQTYRSNAYSDFHLNVMQNLAVYVGIAIENTKSYVEIQKQKNELQQVNAAKDRLFSIIGHDLRTPVGTIKSFLDLIIENPEMTNTANVMEIFKTMQQSLGSAYALLDNLLLWARTQRGQLDYKPEDFKISEPINESLALVADSARSKGIKIHAELNDDALVYADKNMITTVLRNIIANATKFTKRKGNIRVVSKIVEKPDKLNNKLLEVSVIDDGVGISKKNIERILRSNEVFTTPGTNKEQGSGLGIGICIEFLAKHGQTLIVENNMDTIKEPGATFKFHLSLSDV